MLLVSMSTLSVAVQAVKKSLLGESSRVVGTYWRARTMDWDVCLAEELVMAGSSPAGRQSIARVLEQSILHNL